jgi:hypothetical protein
MEFQVVQSERDLDFDPIKSFSSNQSVGFFDEIYSRKLAQFQSIQVASSNAELSKVIALLNSSLFRFIDNSFEHKDNLIHQLCSRIQSSFDSIPVYNLEVSQALVELINTIKEVEESTDSLEEYRELIWEECLYSIIESPACPRPLIWHLIDCLENGTDFNWVATDLGGVSALLWPLMNNWVLGDTCFRTIMGSGSMGTTAGSFNALLNPSFPISAIETIEPFFNYEYSFELLDKDLIQMAMDSLPGAYVKFNRILNQMSLETTLNFRSDTLSLLEFSVYSIRILTELSLGRTDLVRLSKSPNAFIRTVAFHHPELSESLRSTIEASDLIAIEGKELDLFSQLYV